MYKKITATFLDEISYDIPSQNWGAREWTKEFDSFLEAGIDTVVLIRAGLGAELACPSAAIARHTFTQPVHVDLVRLFLDLAAERGMSFYLGLYDSNFHWYRYDWKTEVAINRDFIREAWEEYGDAAAFKGWYLTHETGDTSLRIIEINIALAEQIRTLTPSLSILASPYFFWSDQPLIRGQPRGPEEHEQIWDEIFARYSGLVDFCAFQDGTPVPSQYAEYFRVTKAAADRHGIQLWANVETFDRDMPGYPPADWRKLASRLDAVQEHVEKVITFEFSHFLSPNSSSGAARLGYRRYLEFLETRRD